MKPIRSSFIFLVFNVVAAGLVLSCTAGRDEHAQADIPYPQPLPDTVAKVFLPGVISKDSLDFNAAFAPDGRSFYFTRSENKKLTIYCSRHEGGSWSEPTQAPFTEARYAQADPAFGADGSLYFISNRPKDQTDTLPDYDIWFVSPQAGGGWSAPQNLQAVNTDSAEYYISFAQNGNLYFASSRAGGLGEEDIYVSRWTSGQYTAPQNLGASVNSEKSEYDPGVSPAEDLIVFASSGRLDTFGGADLYGARRFSEGNWQPATHFDHVFNTSTREYCPYFSPDSRYFFFTSERDVKWIGINAIMSQFGEDTVEP